MAHQRCDCGKVCYGFREAHTIIKDARRNRWGRKTIHKMPQLKVCKRIPRRAYYCIECRQWHITSSNVVYRRDHGRAI